MIRLHGFGNNLVMLLLPIVFVVLSNSVMSRAEVTLNSVGGAVDALSDAHSITRRALPLLSGHGGTISRSLHKRPRQNRARSLNVRRRKFLKGAKVAGSQRMQYSRQQGEPSASLTLQPKALSRRLSLAGVEHQLAGVANLPNVANLAKVAAAASGANDGTEQRGRSLALGNMIEQLSTALHRSLVRNRTPKEEGRDNNEIFESRQNAQALMTESDKTGGGNDYFSLHPEMRQQLNLPECATQQVCNAVYVRLNMTQPLCSCPLLTAACSASVVSDDQHTIELKMGTKASKAVTMIKTCEPVWSVRECRAPRDWSILALQNTRTGKAHYLVICKCPDGSQLDGPLNHDQPTYAQVPGIRVYGMMCIATGNRAGRTVREAEPFPWSRVQSALQDPATLAALSSDQILPGLPVQLV